MADLEREWAGRERVFRLTFGGVLDLEEACDSTLGAIFDRLGNGGFGAKDVVHTIRLALIGGGMDQLAAKRLVIERFELGGALDMASLAVDVLISIMDGVEVTETPPDGVTKARFRFSEVSQICREFSMSPQDLRALSYADFCNLVRGFNAGAKGDKVEPPSEEEFEAMLARDAERSGIDE